MRTLPPAPPPPEQHPTRCWSAVGYWVGLGGGLQGKWLYELHHTNCTSGLISSILKLAIQFASVLKTVHILFLHQLPFPRRQHFVSHTTHQETPLHACCAKPPTPLAAKVILVTIPFIVSKTGCSLR